MFRITNLGNGDMAESKVNWHCKCEDRRSIPGTNTKSKVLWLFPAVLVLGKKQ